MLLFYEKYMLSNICLNLMPAACFQKVGTGTTKDWKVSGKKNNS